MKKTENLRALCEAAAARGRLVITGHDRADVDSAASCVLMQRLLAAWGVQSEIVLCEPDGQSRRVMARFGVDVQALAGETAPEDALILVDHHQTAHAGRAIACIDHHPTEVPPDFAFVEIGDSGACAVMVLRLMQEAGVPVTQEDERLAVTALYLDTIALKSAKIGREEAAWGEAQAGRLGLDEDWLRREGMGLMDMSLPAQELAMLGKKVYLFGKRRVLSTYVQTDAMTEEKLGEILAVLREALAREQADLWVFLVHDPVRLRSTEVDLTPDGQVRTIPYDVLISRGRDVMPRVERAMRKDGV
ncbi:MAG: bifunctional oligoribonuclease/PAP phosphatase NrnA [Candidatus Ventricola sp.]